MFKRKNNSDNGNNESLDLFKRYLFVLLNRLTSAYSIMPLSWWHSLMSFLGGLFFGVFIAYVIVSLVFPQKPTTIIIPLNETHIIQVKNP